MKIPVPLVVLICSVVGAHGKASNLALFSPRLRAKSNIRAPSSILPGNTPPLTGEILSLQGGGVDGTLATKTMSVFLGATTVLAFANPSLVGHNYFKDDSPQGSFLIRVKYANVATWVVWAVCLVLLKSDNGVHTALTALGVVNTLDTLRTFVMGDIAKCGLIPAGQYFMLITPIIATVAGLTQASWATLYLKIFMAAYIFDGIVTSNSPSTTAKAFFGPNHEALVSQQTLTLLKVTGWWILAIGISGMAMAYDVEPIKALGYGMITMAVACMDFLARTNLTRRPRILMILLYSAAAFAMTNGAASPTTTTTAATDAAAETPPVV